MIFITNCGEAFQQWEFQFARYFMATEVEAVAKQSNGFGVIFRKRNIGRTVRVEIAAFSEMWTKHGGEDWRRG